MDYVIQDKFLLAAKKEYEKRTFVQQNSKFWKFQFCHLLLKWKAKKWFWYTKQNSGFVRRDFVIFGSFDFTTYFRGARLKSS